MSTTRIDPAALKPGELVDYFGVTCQVLRLPEQWEDLFGRTMFKVWAERHDTEHRGWLLYGPGKTANLVDDHIPGVIQLRDRVGCPHCNPMPPIAGGPHSRSCGIIPHPHGITCRADCPTCQGKDPS